MNLFELVRKPGLSLHSERSARLAAAMLILLLPPLYFLPATLGNNLLAMGDSWSYSILVRMLLGQLLRQGVLPLWNPYVFGGMPLLAAIQPGVLYPPNWLFVILPPGVALNAVVITTYHLALLGTYLFLRELGTGRAAALLAGVTFTFGGFMIAHLEQLNFIAAAAWLPWVLVALERMRKAESWRAVWRAASCGALIIALHCFAGLPQATWHIALVCAAYLGLLWLTQLAGPARWRFAGALAIMALGGVLLSAIQLLPTRELQLQGERAAIPYDSFALFSLPPRRLLAFIAPYFFGGALPSFYHVGGWDHWWLHKYVHGYAGLLPLLLAPLALACARGRAQALFWLGVALVALFLSLGDELPFGLNRWLYHIPIYNLFRGPYRHTFEYTFAVAVLAGLGLDGMRRMARASLRRILLFSTGLLAVVTAGVVMFYLYGTGLLATAAPAPARSLANAEILIPLLCLGVAVGALWCYFRRPTRASAMLVLSVQLLDLAGFGWFTYWRTTGYEAVAQLNDPPAIQAIKARESDLQGFRIVTNAANPYNQNYAALSHGNLAIARGLQSASGYDPMRLPRPAALAGQMDIFGAIPDKQVFDTAQRGLDLLNVKYLLQEAPAPAGETEAVVSYEGIPFKAASAEHSLQPGARLEFDTSGFQATELVLVTSLANSGNLADETVIARLRLHMPTGVIEREFRAGRDSSEWAYERADVRAGIKHRRAKVVESYRVDDAAGAFEGRRYLARFAFPRTAIGRVEFESLVTAAQLVIARASLFDAQSKRFTPVEQQALPAARWQLLGKFGEIHLYQNLRMLPRAWLVNQVRMLPSAEVLHTIKTGRLPDGAEFDPGKLALVEEEDFAGRATQWPDGAPPNSGPNSSEVELLKSEPLRLVLQTQAEQASLLVLSEAYYRGWEAWVDGARTPVERVDYALRGVRLPAGKHEVVLKFQAPSFWQGAAYSFLGLLFLVVGMTVSSRRMLKNIVAL